MKRGDYIDESIIRLREFYQKKTVTYDLKTDAILIRGKEIRFVPVSLFDEMVSVLIPKHFIEMPEEIAKVKYISSYRSPVILTGSGYDENFGFHLLREEDILNDTSLDSLIQQMEDAVLAHAPETMIYDHGSVCTNRIEGRWFEYKNFTLDEETYHIQFLIHSRMKVLVGMFHCRMAFYDEWKPHILKSLEYVDMKEKGEGSR